MPALTPPSTLTDTIDAARVFSYLTVLRPMTTPEIISEVLGGLDPQENKS
jgi:hypothetical protein